MEREKLVHRDLASRNILVRLFLYIPIYIHTKITIQRNLFIYLYPSSSLLPSLFALRIAWF